MGLPDSSALIAAGKSRTDARPAHGAADAALRRCSAPSGDPERPHRPPGNGHSLFAAPGGRTSTALCQAALRDPWVPGFIGSQRPECPAIGMGSGRCTHRVFSRGDDLKVSRKSRCGSVPAGRSPEPPCEVEFRRLRNPAVRGPADRPTPSHDPARTAESPMPGSRDPRTRSRSRSRRDRRSTVLLRRLRIPPRLIWRYIYGWSGSPNTVVRPSRNWRTSQGPATLRGLF